MAQLSPDCSALAASASSGVSSSRSRFICEKANLEHLLRLFQGASAIVKLHFVNRFGDFAGAQQIGSTSTSA
jgi:hypothetical protein